MLDLVRLCRRNDRECLFRDDNEEEEEEEEVVVVVVVDKHLGRLPEPKNGPRLNVGEGSAKKKEKSENLTEMLKLGKRSNEHNKKLLRSKQQRLGEQI